jgi:imidazolonepropionase-like amidohydrolase
VSSIDTIDATADSLQTAQAGGVTTVNVMPGSRNLVGGQTAYLKLRDAHTVDELMLCADRRTEICGGMKMANGTNSQGEGTYPRTRMASVALVRQALLEVKKRQSELPPVAEEKPKKKKKGDAKVPGPDLGKDALIQVLDGRRTVHFHTHRADDIVTILELGEEFGFKPVLHHVSEGWKVADRVAASGSPCSVIVIDSPGGKEEAYEASLTTAGVLEKAGVLVAIHTDDPITDSRLFLRSAALAIRGGMTEEGALKALTINGAKILGLDARVGSLETGKDADFVVLSGEPFSVWTRVEQTFVEGEAVYDRATDVRWATGGWAQADRYPALPTEKTP